MRGFACHPCYHGRGALLPHLFTLTRSQSGLKPLPYKCRGRPLGRPDHKRCIFCATVLQVTLTGRYPAHCPAEFGLSSSAYAVSGLSGNDRLAYCDSSFYDMADGYG